MIILLEVERLYFGNKNVTYQMCTFAEKLHLMLKQDGGIKALLGMFRSGHADVIAQIARGIANFAKCESRMISQGL